MLQKQNLSINFTQGLNTKSDPFQIAPGQFLQLTNTIFTKQGLLQKRNGFDIITTFPATPTLITTFNNNLTAAAQRSLFAYSSGSNSWVNKGIFRPVMFDTLPLVRSAINQSYCDSAVASNGLVCTVYTNDDPDGSGGVTPSYRYIIADVNTGQVVKAPTAITPTAGTVTYSPKVFILGGFFVIIFDAVITAADHLEFIAVSVNDPTVVTTAQDISGATYTAASTGSFDAVLMNNALYVAWNGNAGGGSIRVTSISSGLSVNSTTTVFAGYTATHLGVSADTPNSTIYIQFYDNATTLGYAAAVDNNLNKRFATPTLFFDGSGTSFISNVAPLGGGGSAYLYYERVASYAYDSGIPTNSVSFRIMTQAGVMSGVTSVALGVGLASKPFTTAGVAYTLCVYKSTYQSTFFLVEETGRVMAKFAYGNAGGYLVRGLPNVNQNGTVVQIPYLLKDLVQSVNKGTALPTGTQTAGIYSQLGVNLATIDMTTSTTASVEIGGCLEMTGGFLWQYDGNAVVENGFFLYPDSIEATWSASGGSIVAQPDGATNTDAYYYQVTYEWADNNGNIYRSAPSIPIAVTTTGTSSSGSITVHVPTLRLTYKLSNPVKIVIYRWSVNQQSYYQVTSLSSPLLNDTTANAVTFVDTLADTTILGNNLLYTTGGIVENISTPPASAVALYQSRLFMIDAEDKNLLWFSKQVIEQTPVEMSDLFTIFIPPTTGAQGSTGDMKCLSVMDDKLIIFKDNAMYYINGAGPDNTGANSQFSEPTLISATVGCDNPQSIVFTPNGLMFQSGKGIWLLGRDLSTNYIGAPVEAYNDTLVTSALCIPGTNQVRLTLDNNITLMYDYYYSQWGTFTNVGSISATLYNNLHTYINEDGDVYQETPGVYLDGSTPVLMYFQTGWFNLMGLQGFQRAYFFYLLGNYISAHKLSIGIAYNYSPTASQTVLISPTNPSPNFGDGDSDSDGFFGNPGPFGGSASLEQWRVFFKTQKCQSFQLTVQEQFDPTVSPTPGAGLTLSGINLIVGAKKGYTTIRSANSIG